MELPIFLGATDDNMAFGAAHLTYTSLPIGGESTNCVLAAHTGYIGRVFFDDIRYLQIGDVVTITNYWDKLTYKVTDKQIYKKYESSIIPALKREGWTICPLSERWENHANLGNIHRVIRRCIYGRAPDVAVVLFARTGRE